MPRTRVDVAIAAVCLVLAVVCIMLGARAALTTPAAPVPAVTPSPSYSTLADYLSRPCDPADPATVRRSACGM